MYTAIKMILILIHCHEEFGGVFTTRWSCSLYLHIAVWSFRILPNGWSKKHTRFHLIISSGVYIISKQNGLTVYFYHSRLFIHTIYEVHSECIWVKLQQRDLQCKRNVICCLFIFLSQLSGCVWYVFELRSQWGHIPTHWGITK